MRPAYAHEATHPRWFVVQGKHPGYAGMVFTQRQVEARHIAPHARNLREIIRDGPTTHEGRRNTLSHLLEHFATRGMNAVFSDMCWPQGHTVACKLAPRDMEMGSVFADEDGADILLSHGMEHDSNPPIMCGIDVKSQARCDARKLPTFSIKLGGPVFDIYAGAWPVTPDASITLHDTIHRCAHSNAECIALLGFMEQNVMPFGRFMVHRFATRLSMYEETLRAQRRFVTCKPEISVMYPREPEVLLDLMDHIRSVNEVFFNNGVLVPKGPRYMQNVDRHMAFLPQTSPP